MRGVRTRRARESSRTRAFAGGARTSTLWRHEIVRHWIRSEHDGHAARDLGTHALRIDELDVCARAELARAPEQPRTADASVTGKAAAAVAALAVCSA